MSLSDEHYRFVVENASEGIAICQGDRFKYVNPAVSRVTGWDSAVLLSRPLLEFVHPADREMVTEIYAQRLDGKSAPANYDFRFLGKDGGAIWMNVHCVRIEWEQAPATLDFLTDVTPRKMAEDALRESEARTREVVEHAPIGAHLYQLAPGGRLVFSGANRAADQILRLDHQQFIGQSIEQAFPALAGTELPDAYRRVAARGERFHLDCVEYDDRSIRGVFDVDAFQTGSNRMAVFFQDVSARRRAEKAIQSIVRGTAAVGEPFFRSLVLELAAALQVRYCFVGQLLPGEPERIHTVAVAVGGAIAENFDYDLQDSPCSTVVGQSLLCYPDHVQAQFPEDPLLAELGVESYMGVPLFTATGQPMGLAAVMDDKPMGETELGRNLLTIFAARAGAELERLQAEQTLRESETRYRALVETSEDAIFQADPQGRFLFINTTGARNLGRSVEEMTGLTVDEVFQTAQAEKIRQILAEVRACRAPRVIELPIPVGDRILHTYTVLTPLLGEDGQVVSVMGVARDVTERKKAEEDTLRLNLELEQRVSARTSELSQANASLARAARLKDEFLANMSHELRTPLTSVLSLAEALQFGVYGPLAKKQVKALNSIRQSGRHLLELINDILDLSKMEAGRVELQFGPVQVDRVCQASMHFVRLLAHKKSQCLSFQHDLAVQAFVADERRVKQILVNLLSNAVKFTPDGGAIGLEVAGDREHGMVRFTVWDTGIGIAPADLTRLFQPFTQLDSRLGREYHGTGLGLSLVQGMAELHGGGVSVESDEGQGSRFTVTLPWREPEEGNAAESGLKTDDEAVAGNVEPPTKPLAAVPIIGPKLLLVDDDETVVSALADFLRSRYYEVETAGHAAEALALAREKRPALILLDIQLPGMDGLTVIRTLRQDLDPGLAAVPIIALTALAMPGDRERCLDAGATDYLPKPVELERLAQAIDALLAESGTS